MLTLPPVMVPLLQAGTMILSVLWYLLMAYVPGVFPVSIELPLVVDADLREMPGEIAALAKAHVELREDLEKQKKKRHSFDKLLVHVWKGVKVILKHLSPGIRTPQATRRDLPEFSFLSGFEEGAVGDPSSGSDKAFN
ncbi:hypothetical protein HAX54_049625 [Datura stramonium]|uniref:Uncharacterized protein n=1 Tax=Datura stramonium TaxID=4076 RepID=A0ABS8WN65_DATST|nr:hypothetical protein [Datura stramonium]